MKARRPMLPADHSRRELWWDAISCVLLSFCTMLLLDSLFRFHADTVTMFGHAVLMCTVLLAVGRRFWIWPAVVGGTLTPIVLLLALGGHLRSAWETLVGFVRWWAALFPLSSPYNTAESIGLVHWISHLGICIVVCLLVRALRQTWTPGLLLLCFGVAVLLLGFEVSAWALVAGLLGWLMLFVSPALSGAHYGKAAVALLGVGALLLGTMLSATSLLPVSSHPFSWYTTGAPGTSAVGKGGGALYDLGLQQESDKLGGPISLNDNSEVLRVSSRYGVSLMRVGVYDVYTGSHWYLSDTPKTLLDDETADQMPGLRVPESWEEVEYRVTVLTEGTVLPHFGAPMHLDGVSQDVYFDRNFLFSTEEKNSFSYTLHAAVPRERDRWGTVPAATTAILDYLQLPENLPDSVRKKAHEITLDSGFAQHRMEAICTYLKTNFRYTLNPSNVPDGEDFVDYFLKTGRGYCTYFATAMAVMARTVGVPSRLVYGYALEKTGSGEYTAYGRTAHTWVECYVGGMWYAFDPTPGTGYENGVRNEDLPVDPFPTTTTTTRAPTTATTTTNVQTGESTSSTVTQPSATETTTTTAPAANATTTAAPPPAGGPFPWGWLGIACAVLAGLLLLSWRVLTYARGYTPETVRARFASPDRQLRFYLRDIRRQAALLGCPLQREDTLTAWKQRAAALSPRFVEAITAAEACFYGDRAVTDDTVLLFASLREDLEIRLRETLSFPRYVWHRWLLL